MAPPKRSCLWLYFEEIPETAKEKKSGKCNTCGLVLKMSQSSTTSLKNHLKSRHKDEYQRFLAQDAASKQADEAAQQQVEAAEEATGHIVSHGESFSLNYAVFSCESSKFDVIMSNPYDCVTIFSILMRYFYEFFNFNTIL